MSLRQYLFARLMGLASRFHEPRVAAHKRHLFSGIDGDVLEIGPGAGGNFAYLPREVRWTGYEPNPHLAAQIPLPSGATLHPKEFEGERANAFDWAICTLVLCSVADPSSLLRSIFDCLRPGGKLLFLEHVAAPPGSALASSQKRWQPLWSFCADGCCPNRDTASAIRKAGFRVDQLEEFQLPLWLASPHICGIASKP